MAINLTTDANFVGRHTAATPDYPFGSAKDETSPGAGDGSPYILSRANDLFGFMQALLEGADITPSGNADTALVSQYLDAAKIILKSGLKTLFHNARGEVQQRADGTLSTSYIFGGDRWAVQAGGTVSAGAIGTTSASSAGLTGFAHAVAGVTLTGAGKIRIRSRYESRDCVDFINSIALISAEVFHDVGSNIDYTITVNKADALDDFSSTTLISASSAISVPTSVGTLIQHAISDLGDVTNGIEIVIEADCGAVTTKLFEFTDMQFSDSSVVLNFPYTGIDAVLSRCKRFFRKTYDQGVDPGTVTNIGSIRTVGGSNVGRFAFHWDYQDMRATPSITTFNPNSGATGSARNTTDNTDTNVSASDPSNKSVNIVPTSTDSTDSIDYLSVHATADAEL